MQTTAARLLLSLIHISPEGVNIGMRNISLSTCGLVPKIDQLAEKKLQLTPVSYTHLIHGS